MPPVPVITIFPVVLLTEAAVPLLLSICTPPYVPAPADTPCPRIEILPAPEVRLAPEISTPTGFAALPIAATLIGVAPPPKTILPPFELIDVPGAIDIAPPPVASESEFRVTASVPPEAATLPPVAMRMFCLPFSASVLADALLCVIAFESVTSNDVPVAVIVLVVPFNASAPVVVMLPPVAVAL